MSHLITMPYNYPDREEILAYLSLHKMTEAELHRYCKEEIPHNNLTKKAEAVAHDFYFSETHFSNAPVGKIMWEMSCILKGLDPQTGETPSN
jgi:hypothetical protein